MRVNPEENLKVLREEFPKISRETRESYQGALWIFLPLAATMLIGSFSFSTKLELFYTILSKRLTIVSWVSLVLSVFLLVFALAKFLIQQSLSFYEMSNQIIRAQIAIYKNENTMEIKDSNIFMNFYLATAGLYLFLEGFLNLSLALLSKYIYISFLSVILFNALLIMCLILLISPLVKVNDTLEELFKKHV